MKKNIFIVSASNIFIPNSAAYSRIYNYSRALIEENKVYWLYLFANINNSPIEIETNLFCYKYHKKNKINYILSKLFIFIYSTFFFLKLKKYLLKKHLNENNIILIYPSTQAGFDIAAVLMFKVIFHQKLFYELNELRVSAIKNFAYSKHSFKFFLEVFQNSLNFVLYRLGTYLLKYYDGVIVISTNLMKVCQKYNTNIIQIPILVQINEYNFLQKDYKKEEAFTICFSGSITLKKEGFHLLYEAIKILINSNYNIQLHLYGHINNREKEYLLKTLPERLKISKFIRYHGIIRHEEICKALKNYHLLILPRTKNEQTVYGFSTKLGEYLISGIPCLVTDVSDNSIYIRDGFNGFIIEPGSSILLADKIISIIKYYNKSYKIVSENGFNTAKNNFDYKVHAKTLNKFLT